LRKVKGATPRLIGTAVLLLGIRSIDVIPDRPLINTLVIIGRPKIEFVIDNTLLPFTIAMKDELPDLMSMRPGSRSLS